ncbi:MAG: hypothetical protein EDM03_00330 [Porphyrobacter sp. IPPAS B-1204]|nr:MAG: hypothetical protein EDM03_00330 [Porphyrobacter sp. IPPAS B-1204]
MENRPSNTPSGLGAQSDTTALAVLTALEQQLAALDSLGAHIAAAHVDAAIQQLRADLARQTMR